MATFPNYPKLVFPGFAQNRDPALVRTEMEVGPPKQTKIKSRVLVERPVTYHLDSLVNYNNFINFFTNTINRGADWFDWTDPVDNVVKAARIKGGQISERPRRKDLDRWEVTFILETWDA